MKLCTIDNCENKHYAKGLCNKHFQRFKIYGDPKHPFLVNKPGLERPSGKYLVIKKKFVHILKIEHLLGKTISHPIEIHHVDGNGKNNNNENLVVCPNHEYHFLLHRRTVAMEACGDANKRKCTYCKSWDYEINLKIRKTKNASIVHHRACELAYNKARNEKTRLKKIECAAQI